jgi:hypothetical protein
MTTITATGVPQLIWRGICQVAEVDPPALAEAGLV